MNTYYSAHVASQASKKRKINSLLKPWSSPIEENTKKKKKKKKDEI